jgi:hypothetical protein
MATQEELPDFLEFVWIWNNVQNQPTPAPHRRIARWLQARRDAEDHRLPGQAPQEAAAGEQEEECGGNPCPEPDCPLHHKRKRTGSDGELDFGRDG